MIDESTESGARVARHLREEVVVWLTTVSPSGAPMPRPVWFLWDGAETISIYSLPGARVRNLESNPRVALNFRGTSQGGDIVVLSGTAAVAPDAPSADRADAYLAKYRDHISRIGLTPESFAERYSVPLLVRIKRVRGS